MARSGVARPQFGVFAEGPTSTDTTDLPKFQSLWRELCARYGCADGAVRVYGFNKEQIRALKAARDAPPVGWSTEPLDVLIDRMYQEDKFENVIIAFDRRPPNEAIDDESKRCLRTEVNFILEAVQRRRILGQRFLDAAAELLARYRNFPKQARPAGRPPFGPLELLFMDPMFEAILVYDDSNVLRALELERRPKDWPSFKARSVQPDQHVLGRAIEAAARHRKVSLPAFRTDKHGWALKILHAAAEDSRLWKHDILVRLETLLVHVRSHEPPRQPVLPPVNRRTQRADRRRQPGGRAGTRRR